MAWLQSHQTLARHPKTLRAAKSLGVSIPTLIGHLHLLWWWCLDYAQDGDLSGLEGSEIAQTASWEGDPQAFVDALLNAGLPNKTGFLERSLNGHLVIHDWDEYAGLLIDRRKKDAQHKRDVRKMSGGHPTDILKMSALREEKSKETKETKETGVVKGGQPLSFPDSWNEYARQGANILLQLPPFKNKASNDPAWFIAGWERFIARCASMDASAIITQLQGFREWWEGKPMKSPWAALHNWFFKAKATNPRNTP